MNQRNKFHVFLSHNSADKPAVEELAQQLKQVGLEPWLDKWNLIPGDEWQPALEEALENSATCAVFIGPSGLGAWQHAEMRTAISRRVSSQSDDEKFRVIPVLLPGAVRGERSKLPEFLTATTWVEFPNTIKDETAFRILERAIRGLPPGPTSGVPVHDCPYRGLEFFDVQHSGQFFGREAVLDWLLSAIRGSQSAEGPIRFIAIVGASGSGKSSLARAGLLAALKTGGIQGSEDWPIAICRPGSSPLESLADSLAKTNGITLGQGLAANLIEELKTALLSRESALHVTVRASLGSEYSSRRLVLLVDQFEELFTACSNDTQRQAFIANLLYAARQTDGQTIVLLTMRADFYGRCAANADLASAISSQQLLIGALNETELRDAICRPLQLVGCELEAGLCDLILADVRGQPGSLPLLQHTLRELWNRRHGRSLRIEDYHSLGGIQRAIASTAETEFNAMPPPIQELAKNIFTRLTRMEESEEADEFQALRRRVALTELVPNHESLERISALVDRLVKARLLVTSAIAESNSVAVEVAHEALLRNWPRIQIWTDEDRTAIMLRDAITEAAKVWASSDAGDDLIMHRGARLEAALRLSRERNSIFNACELAYLTRCRNFADEQCKVARRNTLFRRMSLCTMAVLVVATMASIIWGTLNNPGVVSKPPSGIGRALLVGCSTYPNLTPPVNLKSPINDTALIRRTLVSGFGFDERNIVTLSGWPDVESQRPTRSRIEQEFRILAERASEGDEIVIYLGGYSTRLPNDPAGKEPLQTVFLPSDTEGIKPQGQASSGVITSNDLLEWMAAITQKKASLWVIYDACYGSGLDSITESDRDLDLRDELVGAVVTYSCKPNENSPELPRPPGAAIIPANYHGLFTYTLCECLNEMGSPLSYNSLMQRIRDKYRIERGSRGPTPWVAGGDRNRLVFGGKWQPK